MAETENREKSETVETEVQAKTDKGGFWSRFTFLVFLACLLSAGSLAYSTWSFMDLNQIEEGRIVVKGLNFSIVGLSAAATMDLIWSATMVAEYKGRQIRYVRTSKNHKGEVVNVLPYIGWFEVLAVAAMLGYHGHGIGNGAAVFTAILPLATKFTWLLALDDLRDPTAPTDDEMREINATKRAANVKFEKVKAMEKAHEAALEANRRENERKLEDKRVENAMKLLDKETDFELKEMELRQDHRIKNLDNTLKTELQMSQLDSRMQIEAMRDDHAWAMSLRNPTRMIAGQVIPQRGLASRPSSLEIEGGMQDQDVTPDFLDLAAQGLSPAEQKRANLARAYYMADAQHGGTVTKSAFCKANTINPPRLSEATKDYPVEWFVQHGLATWMVNQD